MYDSIRLSEPAILACSAPSKTAIASRPCRKLERDSGLAMDPDTEVDFDFSPFLVRYKSGRVHRLMGSSRASAGVDAATGVTCKDVLIDADAGLAARLYLPKGVPASKKLPVLVYFHGGAFVVQTAFSAVYYRFLNALVAAAGVVAVCVDYRLAPEHPLPAAYHDAYAALRWTMSSCSPAGTEPWLAEHGDAARIFVAGDSAGANIAHNVAMKAGSARIEVEGMALLHPYFRGRDLLPSEGTNPRLARTEAERGEETWAFVCAGRYGIDHPFINPLAMPAEQWATLGCRRALVTVGDLDTLRDRTRRYVETLRGSAWGGQEALLHETDGEGHAYFLEKSGQGHKADKEMDAVVSFIKGRQDGFIGGSTCSSSL
nr:probable carboxylesterase 13 [Lolium perenne]